MGPNASHLPPTSFVYFSLQHSRDEFRLVTILAPNSAEPDLIECKITHESLATPPPYVALSYFWGSSVHTHTIRLNGLPFGVTRNLYEALVGLRKQEVSTVWVDALCINQEDLDERSQQVLRMGAVYRRASETIAWVGNSKDGSNRAIDMVENLSASVAENSDWEALALFITRPYWLRVWIIQELALSREITILCGERRTTWERLHWTVQDFPPDIDLALAASKHISDLDQFRRDARESKPIQLLQALARSRSSLASDDHDKIFALLGLTYDHPVYISYPNYSKSVVELWQEMTVSAFEWTRNLDAMILGNSHLELEKPTWVPAFSSVANDYRWNYFSGTTSLDLVEDFREYIYAPLLFSPEDQIDLNSTRPRFRGTADSWAVFVANGPVLTARGFPIDTVDTVSQTLFELEELSREPDSGVCGSSMLPDPAARYASLEHKLAIAVTLSLVYAKNQVWLCDINCLDWLALSDWHHLVTNNPRLYKWLLANQDFFLYGFRLREWFNAPSKEPSYISKSYSMFQDERNRLERIISENRRLMTTKDGCIGWADENTQCADSVWLFLGCSVPVILRKRQSGPGYTIVGMAWIHGVMSGQLMKDLADSCWVDIDIY